MIVNMFLTKSAGTRVRLTRVVLVFF